MQVPTHSYVSLDDANAYHAMRPSADKWLAVQNKEAVLIASSDFLDAKFKLKNKLNQAMRNGDKSIPDSVVKAVCELALMSDLTSAPEPQKSMVKVGEIAVQYATGEDADLARFAYIRGLLGDLLENQSGVHILKLVRA